MLKDVGDYYVISDRNCIVLMHVDIEEYSKELGVLKSGERLA